MSQPSPKPCLGLLAAATAALSGSPAWAAQDSPDALPRRRALLVGVQAYPERADWPKLSGPRADLDALQGALLERAGFPGEDVRVLFDEEATREAILTSFRQLVEASSRGDVLLFYFAGHGSQILDQNGDELDGYDETLVPFDAVTPDGRPNDIRDDELRELIRTANRRTDHVVLVFDCCSSGTNVRGDEGDARRFVPSEARGLAGARTEASAEPGPGGEKGSSYFEEELAYVALSACRATQSAYEIELEPGRKRGLFTASLVQELYEPAGELTYRDLLERVRRRVGARRPTQTPLVEGPLGSRLVFARAEAWRAPAYALVASNSELVLSGGTIHGLASGSILSACDELATENSDERLVGRIRITEAGALQSKAAWIDPPPSSSPPRLKAFLVERGAAEERAGFALGPATSSDHEHADALARAIEKTGLLRAVEPQEATYLLWPEETAGVRSWRLFTRGDVALPLAAAMGSDQESARLVSALSRLAFADRLRNLRGHTDSSIAVEISLERLDPKRRPIEKLEPGAEGMIHLRPGDHLGARLFNRSQVPVFASLLVISPDGAIELLELTPEDEPIPPGREARTGSFHTMFEPGNEPFYLAGTDCYRWIVTTRHHDLRGLRQKPVSCVDELRGERGKPLGELAKGESEEAWFTCASEVRLEMR